MTIPVASCDLLSTDAARNGDGAASSGAKEAPELTELVRRGELPPLEERLPEKPVVLQTTDGPGPYGGEWNLLISRTEVLGLYSTIGYEQLLRWRPGAKNLAADQVVLGLAEAVEANEEGTEYTFRLRKGVRWSDGTPFTADDILFWWEDVASNRELTPTTAGPVDDIMRTGAGLGAVEREDDYTVVFRFPGPHGLFLTSMATPRGSYPTNYPAHYLKQFHKKYNDKVEEQAKQEGFDNWVNLFHARSAVFLMENADRPVLNAWKLTATVDADTQRIVADRNPYYWKVDDGGRQLPYLSRVVHDIFEEPDAAVLKVAAGEIDAVDRDINELRNKPVIARDRDRSGYHFFDTVPQQMNHLIIMLNLTHQNPMVREVFGNKNFRVGLSHAINRQEIIDSVFQRQGEAWQAAPRRESPYFSERLAKQYTEHDPTLANELLDSVLPETNSDGIRLGPDGTPLSFQIDAFQQADMIDALEMVQQHWREVGIDMRVNNVDLGLWVTRTESNQHDAAVQDGHGGLASVLDRFFWVPYGPISAYARPWDYWFRQPDHELAEEPPDSVKEQFELEQQIFAEPDQARQTELMHTLLDIAADQFYCIGIALLETGYGIFSNGSRNTPKRTLNGFLHTYLMPTNPQQYYLS